MLKKILKIAGKIILGLVVLLIVAYFILVLVTEPSDSRVWSPDLNVTAYAETSDNQVTLHNIRNIKYRGILDYDVAHYDQTFDLDKIEAAYLYTIPLGKLSSHTMMGFEFTDGKKVMLSIEVRRETDEWFSGIKGMLRQYELIFVWADEMDVVKLRTNFRKDPVYMMKLNMPKEDIRKVFVEEIKRTNEVHAQPEYYNTLFNNCTTNLIGQLRKLYDNDLVPSWKYYVPAYTEELLMEYGLFDDKQTIEELRNSNNISPKAIECGDCENYSDFIRMR